MQTVHLSNHHFDLRSPYLRMIGFIAIIATLFLVILAPGWQHALLSLIAMCILCGSGYWLIRKSWIGYTLTPTHFQQHLFHGGWVVKWNNISAIGICSYEQEGWHQPLPWIGIRLKSYEPYLDAICPRIATEILLRQRALLYLGARQHNQHHQFEDMVLDSRPFCEHGGKMYRGLMAMLANRMCYQRRFYGYDVFIASSDLDRSAEEFVGLTRRYLAAAEPEPLPDHSAGN